MGDEARAHDDAMARWAATRTDVSHLPIALELGPGAMADDGFHPGEPVYRACGEALAAHVAELTTKGRR
jgi:lysophospholipase L1-like esterase